MPSERSASKANAIEPSSKPGNDDGVAGGSADSRLPGGGGGSQLGFDDDAFDEDVAAGVAEPRTLVGEGRALGGGDDSGRALASAAAPVPLGGGDDVDGGAAPGGELAKATVARCVLLLLLARAGSGGGLPGADAGARGAAAPDAASAGSDGGRPTGAPAAAAAFAAAISSGVTVGMRVESMRTAAISVEPSVESEYRPGDTGLLLWGSSPSGFSPGEREPDVELMRVASPGVGYPRAILGLRVEA